jgi:hypothetical protein
MEPTSDETLLTAYLDGELPPAERRRVEQRLTAEPELRQQLSLLDETWHYLDLLEKESPDAHQIETTLKMAAVSLSAAPLAVPTLNRKNKWRRATLCGTAIFLFTFFLGMRSAYEHPFFHRAVERLDMYLAILDDGSELLRQLAVQRVFLPPQTNKEPPIDPHAYEPPQHRGFWSSYPAAFRPNESEVKPHQLFYKNIQKFHSLSWKKKKQIRSLHWDIESAPRRTELILTLQNYYLWRKSLQSYEKTELRRPKPLEEKVADIIELKKRLDKQLPDSSAPILSEIVAIEESESLAETLSELPIREKERLLNETPAQIINDLKQTLR